MKSIILLILTLVFVNCSSFMFEGLKYSKNNSTIEVVENKANIKIEYQSYEYLLRDIYKKSNIEMWTKDRVDREIKLSPHGGYVIIIISRSTIGAANTKYYNYIVQSMDGTEILREKGKDNTPHYTVSQYGTVWWNTEFICINKKVTGPFRVYVIDTISSKRSQFIIYPDKS